MTTPVLRKLEGFGPLTAADKALVATLIATEQAVPARTEIIGEGEPPPSYVHLVTEGLACRYKLLASGKRMIVAFLVPGDFCDLNAFIVKTMDHSIATLAPSRIVQVSKKDLLGLAESPTLARAMFMAALVDGATLREWVANIGQRNAEQRMAHLFCELLARFRAVGLAHEGAIALPINQRELSDALGLSLVHTNRSLQSLRDQGLVTLKHGELLILDPRRLEKKCEFTPNYLHLDEANRTMIVAASGSESA